MEEKLAIFGGPKTIINDPIWPQYNEKEKELLVKCLEDSVGCTTDARPVGYNIEFEKRFAEYHKRKFAVACSNCTQGLEAALEIADLGPSDEILVTPYTFMASVSSIMHVGAVPVFVDIDPETICMDIDKIEEAITPNTKAILIVHFAGYMIDMKHLKEIANRFKLLIIEDAAQAHGASRDGYFPGEFSSGALFSFQRNKNMAAAEGGMFITDNEDLEKKFREFIWHGTRQGGPEGHFRISSNLRITDFQSAVLLAQLEKLDEQNKKRMKECDFLDTIMREIEGFNPVHYDKMDVHPRHLYPFKIDREYWKDIQKQKILDCMRAEGIRCGAGYSYPLYKNPVFENKNFSKYYYKANKEAFDSGKLDFSKLYLPNVEQVCKEIIFIPHFVFLENYNIAERIGSALFKISKSKSLLK